MRVLLNSDITYPPVLESSGLRDSLRALASTCAERKDQLTLPLTTVLEYQRQLERLVEAERKRLTEAIDLLDRYQVTHGEVNAAQAIIAPNLPQLFKAGGAQVEVADPTYEDYADAHRRACLHLDPQPRSDKADADEMRDLVIWSMAIRFANTDGAALLVSRDKIHSGGLGQVEADGAGLVVVTTVDEALQFYRVQTPDTVLFLDMLRPLWLGLRTYNLAVPEAMDEAIKEVRKARFLQGPSGPMASQAQTCFRDSEGSDVWATVEIERSDEGLRLHAVHPGQLDLPSWWQRTAVGEDRIKDPTYAEKIKRLRNLLEGDQ